MKQDPLFDEQISDQEWANRAPSPLSIRRYRDADQNTIWWLHNNALDQVGVHAGNGEWDDDLNHISDVYFARGDFLVGELDGQIVAMGAIKQKSEEYAELKRMRVHPDYQRRGYGRQLLDALEHRARGLGYTRIWLDTTVQQIAAQRLYLKNRFTEVGRSKMGRFELIYYEKRLG